MDEGTYWFIVLLCFEFEEEVVLVEKDFEVVVLEYDEEAEEEDERMLKPKTTI